MSKQYPGGLITKTPVTPSGPYEDSTASGIWTLDQQAYWAKLGQWPTAGNFPKDAQFNYVTMLLHGDGTNGAQNNTFLDSSTNNFTITRNGNTTQGSFSPYGSNWGNYFGASNGNALLVRSSGSELTFTGDFTLETWVYPTAGSSSGYSIIFSSNSPAEQIAYYYTDGSIGCYFSNGANGLSSAGKLSMNAWSHVAVVRNGSTVKIYVNGVDTGVSISGTINFNVGTISGYQVGATGYNVWGYLSNVRLGTTAVYTSNFTPSTTPLTAISGTVLLTCQSNRFIDNSASPKTITTVGSPSVQRFNPFGASTAYSTSVIGGSGYFDGSGDYLSVASNSALQFGTGDFTFECWVYRSSASGQIFMADFGASSVSGWGLYDEGSGGNMQFRIGDVDRIAVSPLTAGAWSHVAVVRSGTTATLYVNGTSAGSYGSASTNLTYSGTNYIGSQNGSSSYINGYMSNVRAVKGTAVYTSTFTPSTSPLTAISGTSLLTNMTNGAIFDNAMINNIGTVGAAQISTSVKKYGTGSMYFNGTNDCCLTTQSAMSSSGPFTFECWAYWNDTGTSTDMGMLCSQYASGQSGRMLFGSQSGALVLRVDGGTVYLTTSVSTGTWYFVAWTFDGTTHRLFLDGVLASSSTSVPALYTGVNTSIGGQPETLLTDYCLDGYMDEVRITKGVARYTTTFTPPTAAFPNIGPT